MWVAFVEGSQKLNSSRSAWGHCLPWRSSEFLSVSSGSSAGLVGDKTSWKGELHADAGDHRGAECGWLATLLRFEQGLRGEHSKVCLTGVIESCVAQWEGGLMLVCPRDFTRDLL